MVRTFGEALQQAMAESGVKKTVLAKASGVPATNLSGYINSRFPPGEDVCQRLADGLNIPVTSLLNGVITKWGLALCAEAQAGQINAKPPERPAAGSGRRRR